MPQVTIDKFVFGGQALGRDGNKICFIWGALPGETVEFFITRKKKNFVEGVVSKVLVASPDRIEPQEKHYLSCSPWQTLAPEKELFWKKEIALETYRRVGNIELSDIKLISQEESFHYRNKIEYSFTTGSAGGVSLAFFERGKHWNVAINGCALASNSINSAAQKVVEWLEEQKVPAQALKSLIVRSNKKGQTVAALFVKNKEPRSAFILPTGVVGFQLYYSNPLSPASNPDELLYSVGQKYLTENILGTTLKYGLLSFFQINPSIFEQAVNDIAQYVSGGYVVDYYSGVGAISLPIAKKMRSLTLVESNSEAVTFAKENRQENMLANVEVELLPAENATRFITSDATIIIDPPRIGLDKRMIGTLLEIKPRRIIYLSCDLATHARDIGLLKSAFTPVFWQLYNFFPRTPHIEGLCVLEAK